LLERNKKLKKGKARQQARRPASPQASKPSPQASKPDQLSNPPTQQAQQALSSRDAQDPGSLFEP
jgi:hypothetical protein